jgi:Mg2+ and Co2+ transporter CorA
MLYNGSMYSRMEHEGLVWIDLESPTHDEAARIVEEFQIDPLVAEEILFTATKPRAEFYGDYAYLVLHFPALRHSHKTREQEIDFIVGKQFIITAHYDIIDPLHKFAKIFEVHSILDKDEKEGHAGFLFFYMLKKLYKAVEHEVDYVRHELSVIEEHIFSDEQMEMVAQHPPGYRATSRGPACGRVGWAEALGRGIFAIPSRTFQRVLSRPQPRHA